MNRLGLFSGLAFGFLLGAARLSDYDVIHRMLLLQEFDVFLLMASAIGVAAPVLLYLERRRWTTRYGGRLVLPRARVERRHIFGSMAFGAGWAIAGTCPGPALVMTVSGNVLGLIVMTGVVSGILLCDRVARRSILSQFGECGELPQPADIALAVAAARKAAASSRAAETASA